MSGLPSLVLGIHLVTRGFGWTAYAGPFAPYAWDIVEVRRDKNSVSLRKLEKVLDRLRPEVLVLEEYDSPNAKRHGRVTRLYRSLVALAADRGVDVAIVSRHHLQGCFRQVGAKTRQEIAEAVARHTPAFRDRLPAKRRPWDSEDLRMSLFCAAALVIAHYAFDANQFLDDLRDAA